MHTKLLIPATLFLTSITFSSLAQDAGKVNQSKTPQGNTVSTNFSGLFKRNALTNAQYKTKKAGQDSDTTDNNKNINTGVFGIEAGAAVEGDGASGALFWYLEREFVYGLKIGFNIGSTVDVDADYSNLGDIIRNADEFGQFTMTGVRMWELFGREFGFLGGISYSQLKYNDSTPESIEDGGVMALKLGILLSSSTFEFSNNVKGTVGVSLAYEHRQIVGDLSNDNDQLGTLFQGNGKSYNGLSTQFDINMSTNQRYFIKLTHFDADGLSGLDGTQINVGLKIDGIFEN